MPSSMELSVSLPEGFLQAFNDSDVNIDMEFDPEGEGSFSSAAITLDDGVLRVLFQWQRYRPFTPGAPKIVRMRRETNFTFNGRKWHHGCFSYSASCRSQKGLHTSSSRCLDPKSKILAAIGSLLKEAAQYLSSELSIPLASGFSERQILQSSSKSVFPSKVRLSSVLPSMSQTPSAMRRESYLHQGNMNQEIVPLSHPPV